jgi:hypothetical protein
MHAMRRVSRTGLGSINDPGLVFFLRTDAVGMGSGNIGLAGKGLKLRTEGNGIKKDYPFKRLFGDGDGQLAGVFFRGNLGCSFRGFHAGQWLEFTDEFLPGQLIEAHAQRHRLL